MQCWITSCGKLYFHGLLLQLTKLRINILQGVEGRDLFRLWVSIKHYWKRSKRLEKCEKELLRITFQLYSK